MHKSRIIELFKNAPEEIKSMKVSDLLDKLQKDVDEENKVQLELESSICEKFKGKYLKVFTKDGLFGHHDIDYIFIKNIGPGSYDTNYERGYHISGDVFHVSKNHFVKRELKWGHASDDMTVKELESAVIITKEEFDEVDRKHKSFEKMINNFMK